MHGKLNPQLSRRQLLGGMAIAGLAGVNPLRKLAAIQGRSIAQSPDAYRSDAKVLVVGAGIAGLTVAYRLHQAGIPVQVIEASQRVGGRLKSLSKPNCPGVVELGGEFIDSRHQSVRALAAELGLELADLRAADAGLEPEILYFQGRKISHSWVAQEFIPLAQRIAQDVEKLSHWRLTYHDQNPDALRLDRLSLAEYLAATPLHPVIEQLIRVAYVTEYGLNAETQSCLNMLFLIGAEAGKWSTYGVSDERYHVVGGNDQIPRRLAERLGERVATGTVLESIRTTADGRYRVSWRNGLNSTEHIYNRIVLTLPFTVLRQIELQVELSPAKQAAIAELGYGTCTKLAIPFQERIWRTRYGSTISVYTDLEFQNTWESARYLPGPGGWLTDLRGGTAGERLGDGSPQTHARLLVNDMEQLFPGIGQVDRGAAVRAAWVNDPYAFGSYSCYLPGQWSRFGGAESEQVGNLWFAGEHCSIGSQGYMNGACETAEQVAQSILQEEGRSV
jgi:monoamine oxidase